MIRGAFAFLALFAFLAPGFGEEAKPMTAILLVSRPDMPDPNFKDSVVLVTNQGSAGPIGLIINKPTERPLYSAFPAVEALASLPDKVYFGGPVGTRMVAFLFRAPKAPELGAIQVMEGVYLSQNFNVLRELFARDNPTEGVRIFAGYAGWMRGQLENEIARGDWHVMQPDASAIFDARPERLWQELNRRASATAVRYAPSGSGLPLSSPAAPPAAPQRVSGKPRGS